MLTGMGYENGQGFLTDIHLKKRRLGLLDRDKLTSQEQTNYGITGADGGGRTNPKTYKIWTYPFPAKDSTMKKKVDWRTKPQVGD